MLGRVAPLALVALVWACSDESGGGPTVAGDGGVDSGSDAELDAGADTALDAQVDAVVDVPPDAPLFVPGDKILLSVENPGHLDEDPSVILAKDGSLHVAWFSQRNGNPDIYVKRTQDGKTWTETRVTQSPSADYYPSLIQDSAGHFHLTWFRWTAFQVGGIWHASSDDGVTWNAEEPVTTTANVDDWTPSIAEAKNGDLFVAFASSKRNPSALSQIYLAKKPAGQSAWLPAVEPPGLGSASQDDVLPILANTGPTLSLAWVRCQAGGPDPCLVPSSNLFFATSTDGTSWSAPKKITNDTPDDVVDTLPSLYPDLAGNWSLLWLSTRTGSVQTSDLPLASLGNYPAAAQVSTAFEGYSPHAAPTPTPGVFLGVWVEDTDPNDKNKKDVFYRFFGK